ncbi:hypothetical protein [Fodinicola acaciae]|uniref:hypothetical protein n=1 Tax=Fodinicola acaciae TaxID=2681555 RepID=UPI0013D1F6F3|nr:hypothetical protein [Fodinicola acaciae]
MFTHLRCRRTDEPEGIREAAQSLAPLAAMDPDDLDKTLRVNLVLLANHMCKLDDAEKAAWRAVTRIRTHLGST